MYNSFLSRCVLVDESVRDMAMASLMLPLCLAVQLLSSCQSRFAVRLGSSSLGWLAILQESATRSRRCLDGLTPCCLLVGQTLEESELC